MGSQEQILPSDHQYRDIEDIEEIVGFGVYGERAIEEVSYSPSIGGVVDVYIRNAPTVIDRILIDKMASVLGWTDHRCKRFIEKSPFMSRKEMPADRAISFRSQLISLGFDVQLLMVEPDEPEQENIETAGFTYGEYGSMCVIGSVIIFALCYVALHLGVFWS